MTIDNTPPINILTIGLSKHIHGDPIDEVVRADWSAKTDSSTRKHFNNVGFDLDPVNIPNTLDALQNALRERYWDGILIGWCTRGYPERTELFERIVRVCIAGTAQVEHGKETRLMFSTGPDNLVETTLRNFPVA